MPIVETPCTFVGSFKVGDNLRYNCDLLCALDAANGDGALNKIIVMQVGSILEAALTQIIYRAQNYNLEDVPNIVEADRKKIEERKIDKFAVAIDVLRKYSVLDGLGADTYDQLHRLRKYRNKIHIQEDVRIEGVSRDEDAVFVDELVAWSIDLNIRVLAHLNEAFARPAHVQIYVGALRVPGQE